MRSLPMTFWSSLMTTAWSLNSFSRSYCWPRTLLRHWFYTCTCREITAHQCVQAQYSSKTALQQTKNGWYLGGLKKTAHKTAVSVKYCAKFATFLLIFSLAVILHINTVFTSENTALFYKENCPKTSKNLSFSSAQLIKTVVFNFTFVLDPALVNMLIQLIMWRGIYLLVFRF